MIAINSWHDIMELLKRFGLVLYTGNRLDDIALAESEIEDLYEMDLIEKMDYLRALAIIRRERENAERAGQSTDI